MRETVEARLRELEREYAEGERRLRNVHSEKARLQEVLLRISGAIQVLHELLSRSDEVETSGALLGSGDMTSGTEPD